MKDRHPAFCKTSNRINYMSERLIQRLNFRKVRSDFEGINIIKSHEPYFSSVIGSIRRIKRS